jgi:hypothetical protein
MRRIRRSGRASWPYRHVDADDGEKYENDDDDVGEEQRLTEDDARRRIIIADAAELNRQEFLRDREENSAHVQRDVGS